jgi:polyribonucleotide 5'-hydroxyl-kinase
MMPPSITFTKPFFSTNIDIPKKKFTILAPNRGSFVGRTAVVGSFEFQEQ